MNPHEIPLYPRPAAPPAEGATALDLGTAEPMEADPARAPRSRWPFRLFRGRREAPPVLPTTDGLEAIRHSCDAAFANDTARLEATAREMGRAAAAAGLPRPDVEYEQIEEELELAARCEAAFHTWVDRVLSRVGEALGAHLTAAAAGLNRLEHEIHSLREESREVEERRAELARVSARAPDPIVLPVHRLAPTWILWALLPLLVLVDWVANVPVFSELLPRDPNADEAWRMLVARSEEWGIWGGAYRIFARALHHPEASILALGVIVFLVWLAHVLGDGLRHALAHSEKEVPEAAAAIGAHRRRSRAITVMAGAGLVLVVAMLWSARAQVAEATADRVTETEARIAAVDGRIVAARSGGDLDGLARLERERGDLESVLAERRERHAYADTIGRLNLPILLLNLALALSAAIAGYLHASGSLQGLRLHPAAAGLARRVGELEDSTRRRRDLIARLDGNVTSRLERAEHLAGSSPLGGWEAKAGRLRAVIPAFRAENARTRGLDAGRIRAFAAEPRLAIGLAEDRSRPAAPPELARIRSDHAALRARLLTPRDPAGEPEGTDGHA